jgi:hypothetical protein
MNSNEGLPVAETFNQAVPKSIVRVFTITKSASAGVDHFHLLELSKVGNQFGNDGHRTISRGLIFSDEALE